EPPLDVDRRAGRGPGAALAGDGGGRAFLVVKMVDTCRLPGLEDRGRDVVAAERCGLADPVRSARPAPATDVLNGLTAGVAADDGVVDGREDMCNLLRDRAEDDLGRDA